MKYNELLQWWGAVFYLLNKVLLCWSEHAALHKNTERARRARVCSWAAYIIGLPAWVILLVGWRNWIAAALEASGAPAMILGLMNAWWGKGARPTPRIIWVKDGLDRLARWCIVAGCCKSLWDFGGITTFNQCLEIALVIGFLVGTYRLAKEQSSGYLWYVLMHFACAWLMWIQHSPWLFIQQLLSLGFIVDAYGMAQERLLKNEKEEYNHAGS